MWVSMRFELFSENSCAEGQTDPDPALIEMLGVALETISWGKKKKKSTVSRSRQSSDKEKLQINFQTMKHQTINQ